MKRFRHRYGPALRNASADFRGNGPFPLFPPDFPVPPPPHGPDLRSSKAALVRAYHAPAALVASRREAHRMNLPSPEPRIDTRGIRRGRDRSLPA